MKKNIFKKLAVGLVAIAFSAVGLVGSAFADVSISMSPLTQKLLLQPGETYEGSFRVLDLESNDEDLNFAMTVEPFSVDDDYNVIYENNGDYNQMVDWIVLDRYDGKVSPGDSITIHFTINVPTDAPAGGQYAAIKATTVNNDESGDANGSSASVKVEYGVAYTIYAEIAGETHKGGKILSTDVPSFLLSGDISGSASIENTGNVHSDAKYTLQVFPLFSNEEVYTNEENPEVHTILPGKTRYEEIAWEGTPDVGIFNVVYTVEFEGVTEQVSKMVIKCPVWLLFIIFFVIAAIIIWIVMRVRGRKKNARKSD